MKLIISINFDGETKDKLYKHMNSLTEKCESGSFTKRDNIHLTLCYIGETTQIGAVVETMDTMDAEQFEINLADGGSFKRSGGDIYWVGIEKNPELVKLQKLLYRSLVRKGVVADKNDFKPHLTVSRDTVINKDDIPVTDFCEKLTVGRISLMKYENLRDGIGYTEVYAKDLRTPEQSRSAALEVI